MTLGQRRMIPVRGGSFLMGSEAFYADEGPVRRESVGDFWLDACPVTNEQFAKFVSATGYVTHAEQTPPAASSMQGGVAVPGSIVFTPARGRVDFEAPPTWWRFVPGASWRRPLGPESEAVGVSDHPVVHVTLADARAYAGWAGLSLPLEREWEYAARGGLEGAVYPWGDELEPGGRRMANIWEGDFPFEHPARDGVRTSAVGSYPPNGYGLFDMIGNVWEWTEDVYAPSVAPASPTCCGGSVGAAQETLHVAKGGSHLCAPNYCRRYRPAARWPHAETTSISHLGFRCIKRA